MSVRHLATVTGLSPGDHVCWPYRGVDDLVESTRDYVAEGLARHELVTYLEIGPAGLQHTVVSELEQVGRPEGSRHAVLTPLQADPWESRSDPRAQLDAMTRAALSGGFSGLRLVSEVTSPLRDTAVRDAWVRAEHLIDRFAVDNPLTALCCYDLDDVGPRLVAEAACVHSGTRGSLSSFAVLPAGTGVVALSGEVDAAAAEDLYGALVRIHPDAPGLLRVDASDLRFIDHAGLIALDRAAQSLVTTIELAGAARIVTWLAHALGLRHVRTGGAR